MISTSNFNTVRIIADDLTGACDTAVAFACVGMTTEVETTWSRRTASKADVIAWNTESRDIDAAVSILRIEESASRLASESVHHVFKKVDSTFRGNSFTEIAACLATFPHELAIVAPAFPELGRTIRNGELTAKDFSGERNQSIFQGLQDTGVHPLKLSSAGRLGEAYLSGAKVLLCDTEAQQDLRAIVRTTLDVARSGNVLWVGSGGLARALAGALGTADVSSCPITTGTNVLFIVGSDHPVTLRQLAHLRLAEGNAIIVRIDRTIDPELLRKKLSSYVDRGISCLFATGGDTALAVCRALDIDCLRVECEFSRGLPQSRILGGAFDGAHFIMKSGGFGEEDVLSRIAHSFTDTRMS